MIAEYKLEADCPACAHPHPRYASSSRWDHPFQWRWTAHFKCPICDAYFSVPFSKVRKLVAKADAVEASCAGCTERDAKIARLTRELSPSALLRAALRAAPLALLLLTSCALSHDVPTPQEVDVSTLDDDARFHAMAAMNAWNDAIGRTVFWLGPNGVRLIEDAPDGVCICHYPDEGTIRFRAYCATREAFMHELGHELGLEDDGLPGSIMQPGLWPNVNILPEHVARVREAMGLGREER